MKRYFDLTLFVLGIIFTGLGIIYRDNNLFGDILVMGGIFLIGLLILLKYAPPVWAKYFDWRILPAIGSTDGKSHPAEEIFVTAAKDGGELLTTNVLHKDLNPESDWASKHFRGIHPNHKLTFARLLLVNDALDEHKWIQEFFEAISTSTQIDATIFVFKNFGSSLLGFVERYIPRINLILFRLENKHYVYIGFDRLIREDKRLNYSLGFSSKSAKVYDLIRPYYDVLVSHKNITSINSIDKLRPVELTKYQIDFIDTAIAKLEKIALDTNLVLHFGLYGSQAKTYSGLYNIQCKEPFDSDADILLIVPSKECIPKLKSQLGMELGDQFNIVWGDVDENFYYFRESHTLDIEIKEKGSNFYSENLLLGNSVFSYYHTIFSHDGVSLSDLLIMPIRNLPTERRKGILLKSRKGIAEFISRLSSVTNALVDPRRIISLALRNLVWCHSGHYPENYIKAIEYLVGQPISLLPPEIIVLAQNILNMEKDEIQSAYSSIQQNALDVLKQIQQSQI